MTAPGPDAAGCVSNGMVSGPMRSLPAILARPSLLPTPSASGATASVAASPGLWRAAKRAGAGPPTRIGMRGWLSARRPLALALALAPGPGRALQRASFAMIDAESVAGRLAARSQPVEPGVPIGQPTGAVAPTAPTAAGQAGHAARASGPGGMALGAIAHHRVPRFAGYGSAPGALTPGRAG